MSKFSLSTGHPELDDILKRNNILDQDAQTKHLLQSEEAENNNQQIVQNIFGQYPAEKTKRQMKCLHEAFNESYKKIGQTPPAMRMLSCPCPKCSPTYL